MRLGCTFADHKLVCDGAIRHALRNKGRDFLFSVLLVLKIVPAEDKFTLRPR